MERKESGEKKKTKLWWVAWEEEEQKKKNQRTKQKRSLVMRKKRAVGEWGRFDNTQTWDLLVEWNYESAIITLFP